MNLYTAFYEQFREDLVRYGWRFDQTTETAEDLFEDCHKAISRKYPLLPQDEYVKLMKTSMRNRYLSQTKREGLVSKYPHPESLSPKPLDSLGEYVCKSEEVELLMLAMARLSQADRELLLETKEAKTEKRFEVDTRDDLRFTRYQAKKRLERRLIEVIANQKHPPTRPDCPYCFSPSLYFRLDQLVWVCEKCGQVTKLPATDWEKNQKPKKEKGSAQP